MKKFVPKILRGKNNVTLSDRYLYLSVLAREEVEVGSVDIFYDVENKAIKIRNDKNGLFKFHRSGNINCSISKVMPKGSYVYNSKTRVYEKIIDTGEV